MKLITIISFILLTGCSLFAQTPINWSVDEINPNEDISLYRDESVFTDGMTSCRLQLNSGAVPYLVSESYNVSPGAAYSFSIDVLDNDTAGQLKVYADFYDSYGFNIYGHTPAFSSDSSVWQTISWDDTIPAQAVTGYVLIKYYCQPDLYHFTKTARAWIDNVQFRQAGGANLVLNSSFEEWVLGVEEQGNDSDPLVIYPNPANDFVNINLPDDAVKLIITDLMGKEVIRINVEGKKKIQVDIERLTAGLYLTRIELGIGSFLSGKVLKH